jgi:hypothetical protein
MVAMVLLSMMMRRGGDLPIASLLDNSQRR